MKIGINLEQLLNQSLNEELIQGFKRDEKEKKDPKSIQNSKTAQMLMKFANDHGFYGISAVMFITDLLNFTLELLQAQEEESHD